MKPLAPVIRIFMLFINLAANLRKNIFLWRKSCNFVHKIVVAYVKERIKAGQVQYQQA